MDSLTQVLLGAAVGQAAAGRTLGRRAALWGAAAGLAPDLDMLAAVLFGARGEFLYHRGPTHSVLVCLVLGLAWGEAVWRRRRRKPRREPPAGGAPPETRRTWMLLFTAALITHPVLDWFTSYGTQLLWPLTMHRFALNGVAIIDPFYTGTLVAGLALTRRGARPRALWAALALSTAYLGLGLGLNHAAERAVVRHLARADDHPPTGACAEVRCYPTLLQPVLRRVVVRDAGGYRIGAFTHFAPDRMSLQRVTPARDPRVARLLDTPLGRIFHWFAMGMVSGRVRPAGGDTVVVEIEDLRYGIPTGAPEYGLWYLTGRFDAEGRLVGPVERRRRPLPAPLGVLLGRLWPAIRGEPVPPLPVPARR